MRDSRPLTLWLYPPENMKLEEEWSWLWTYVCVVLCRESKSRAHKLLLVCGTWFSLLENRSSSSDTKLGQSSRCPPSGDASLK